MTGKENIRKDDRTAGLGETQIMEPCQPQKGTWAFISSDMGAPGVVEQRRHMI